MVRIIYSLKQMILVCWFLLAFQGVKSQEIANIVTKDTIKVISFENANSMIVDDFKIYFNDFTFLFSKKDFLKHLKVFKKEKHEKKDSLKSEFERENAHLENIIKKNKDIFIISFANASNRRIWNFYLKPILNRLIDNNKVVIFHNKQIIESIHKLRIERIGNYYSSTSIEYWHNDIMILQLETVATIE